MLFFLFQTHKTRNVANAWWKNTQKKEDVLERMAPYQHLRSKRRPSSPIVHTYPALLTNDLADALQTLLSPLDYRGVRAFASDELLEALYKHPHFKAWQKVAASVVHHRPILIDAHVMVKPAHDEVPQPTHRDVPIGNIACNQIMNVWEGTTINKQNGMTVIDGDVDIALSYGDTLWHDASTLHHANGNPTEQDRKLLFLVWVTSYFHAGKVSVPSAVGMMMKSWKTVARRYRNVTNHHVRME